MEPYTSTIRVGRTDSTLNIGKKAVVRGLDAEPTILFDFREATACLDLTRAQAQAIVDALTEAIATIPEPVVPDIELPNTDFPYFSEDSTPLSAVVMLDGQKLRLVNWVDYRGWEVRRAESFAPALGTLSTLLDTDGNTYTVAAADGSNESRGFKRVDEALRTLLSWASATK